MLIIGILACMGVGIHGLMLEVGQVKSLLINLRDKPIDTSGITPAEMQDIRHKINAIERFIRTTPLVECGNDVRRREEKEIRGTSPQR